MKFKSQNSTFELSLLIAAELRSRAIAISFDLCSWLCIKMKFISIILNFKVGLLWCSSLFSYINFSQVSTFHQLFSVELTFGIKKFESRSSLLFLFVMLILTASFACLVNGSLNFWVIFIFIFISSSWCSFNFCFSSSLFDLLLFKSTKSSAPRIMA